jgi:pyruvate dehydrogenase E1 component
MTLVRPGWRHHDDPASQDHLEALRSIERRVLWLAVRIVDYANRERPSGDALKVGGHQASSASMVTLMTALYLADLEARDRVAVKPHASPVLHALEYLLGRLDRSYLTRLRDFGGLQSYPSRAKDPFPVDYSTGSVGLGSVAPVFGAFADRYVQSHFGKSTSGRFISLLGDAELDEGSVWEALSEPMTRRLENVLWIVDVNRQSLDRVVPGVKAAELERQFANAGWNVIELKYGSQLRNVFELDGGDLLKQRIDEMPNEQYQSLFGATEDAVRMSLTEPLRGEERDRLVTLLDGYYGTLGALVSDLGGHDISDVLDALVLARECVDRPTVVFAYTIKGYGLQIAGRPQNHSALLTSAQVDHLREEVGLTPETEWQGFARDTAEGALLDIARTRLEREVQETPASIALPHSLAGSGPPTSSTQASFGRFLLELSRNEAVAPRVVTVSPDVSSSTNLGGLINKVGVWSPVEETLYDPMDDSPLKWRVGPQGKHIEVGIAEMNLVLLLGQLGLTTEYQGERLFPIGTIYDPFVMRALEGIVYSVYSGSRFILCGTPSGISLSREGGAHQSINTPGIGMETPGLTYAEPAFAQELEWLLLNALERMQQSDGEALYLRLSTTPVDQAPFTAAVTEQSAETLRRDVIAGGFRLRTGAQSDDRVLLATCGAITCEALQAADILSQREGVEATVLCLSSPDRVYRNWQQASTAPLRTGAVAESSHLEHLLRDDERGLPVVTVIDGASHTLAWLGSALGVRSIALGVDRYGQTGSQPELYDFYDISSEAICTAVLAVLEP